MERILEELRRRAAERFGPARARELEPVLRALAADLEALARFPLEPDDAP